MSWLIRRTAERSSDYKHALVQVGSTELSSAWKRVDDGRHVLGGTGYGIQRTSFAPSQDVFELNIKGSQ